MVTNLVLNALDAMPDGGRVTLTTSVDGESVVCTVSDTGIGMTEEVRQRVFDPFFTTKAEKGTGLGLSVAYGIVTRHGGEIEVRSQPWQGSSFSIRLPVARSTARPPVLAEGPGPVVPARVLVIDDEENVRQVLAELLMAQGHAVAAHADGRSGLARFHDEPFDVVFTDLGMPGLSGWEVARRGEAASPRDPGRAGHRVERPDGAGRGAPAGHRLRGGQALRGEHHPERREPGPGDPPGVTGSASSFQTHSPPSACPPGDSASCRTGGSGFSGVRWPWS